LIQLLTALKSKTLTLHQAIQSGLHSLNLICIINFLVVFYTYSGTESDMAQKILLHKCTCDILWKLQ